MNAASLAAFSARSAAVGHALWPALVELATGTYAATLTEPSKFVGELIRGGEQMDGVLVARVIKALLPTAPVLHGKLRWKRPGELDWNKTAWQIDEITGDSPGDAEWRISCTPKN
jgi:hypothetical protein